MQKIRIALASLGTLSSIALFLLAALMVSLPFLLFGDYGSLPLDMKKRIWMLWSLSSIPAGLSIYLIVGYLKLFSSRYIPTQLHSLIGALSFGICTLISIWSAAVNGILSLPWTNASDILWSISFIACFGFTFILHILLTRGHIQAELSTPFARSSLTAS